MYIFIALRVKYIFNITMENEEVKYHAIIAKNIKDLRKAARLSQEALAENLNCSREFISRVENRKERISLNMLFRIAQFFNVAPGSLLV